MVLPLNCSLDDRARPTSLKKKNKKTHLSSDYYYFSCQRQHVASGCCIGQHRSRPMIIVNLDFCNCVCDGFLQFYVCPPSVLYTVGRLVGQKFQWDDDITLQMKTCLGLDIIRQAHPSSPFSGTPCHKPGIQAVSSALLSPFISPNITSVLGSLFP